METEQLLETALAAARAAVGVHRAHLGRVERTHWSEKGAADFVTHVDREAEAGILAAVRTRFPAHAILAEEEFSEREHGSGVFWEGATAAGWTWIIDPLDGTTNFLHGYPMFAVSIGAVYGGELQVGVVVNSVSGEEWTAVRGGGARRNGAPIAVSSIDHLPHALIGTGFPFKALHLMPQYGPQLERVLRSSSGVRRAGSAALDLCHVATGWFDGFWELTLAPWDVAAGTLIVREAGGVVTRLDGSGSVLGHGSIVAGNPAVHAKLLALLAEGTRADMQSRTGTGTS